MTKHAEHKELRRDGDKTFMDCGCVWIGHSCTMDNMCAEGKRIAGGIMAALNTPEGEARVAHIFKRSQANGGSFVTD